MLHLGRIKQRGKLGQKVLRQTNGNQQHQVELLSQFFFFLLKFVFWKYTLTFKQFKIVT